MRSKFMQLLILSFLMITTLSGCNVKNQDNANKEGIIYYAQTNAANMLAQMRTGEIDAFVAWEPFNAQAIAEGIGRYLIQSGEVFAGHPCCVLALSETEQDYDLAIALSWANLKAVKFINNTDNQDKVLKFAMDFTGRNEASVREALKHTRFDVTTDSDKLELFLTAMQQNGTLIKEPELSGFLDHKEFLRSFADTKYLENVNNQLNLNPDWTPPPVKNSRTVILGYINQDLHHLPLYIALQEGYYNQIGLVQGQNLQLKGYVNGVAVMEAFKANELTASYLGIAPAMLKRLNDNIIIKVIAGVNNEGSAIVVGKYSSIYSIKDLENKTVGIPGLGTVQSYIFDQVVRQNGLTLKAK